MESQRIKCLIAGCNRTSKVNPNYSEWICQKHWCVVPKRYKQLHSLAKRKFKKGQIDYKRIQTIWEKCKDQAHMHAWSA